MIAPENKVTGEAGVPHGLKFTGLVYKLLFRFRALRMIAESQ